MKTYVITLAKTFPAWHPKADEDTYFRDSYESRYKIHTIRTNVPLWAKRMKEVEAGEACLSIREWSGRPYNSKQVEIDKLTKYDHVGMQTLVPTILDDELYYAGLRIYDGNSPKHVSALELSENDGLSLYEWGKWFKFGRIKPGTQFAIIHFTPFRY